MGDLDILAQLTGFILQISSDRWRVIHEEKLPLMSTLLKRTGIPQLIRDVSCDNAPFPFSVTGYIHWMGARGWRSTASGRRAERITSGVQTYSLIRCWSLHLYSQKLSWLCYPIHHSYCGRTTQWVVAGLNPVYSATPPSHFRNTLLFYLEHLSYLVNLLSLRLIFE